MYPADAGGRTRAAPIFLHCFALAGFAFAQPLYELLTSNPTFFVAHHATALQVLALVLVVSVALPAGLALLVRAAARLSARAGRAAWLSVVGLLATLVLLPPLKSQLPGSPTIMLLLALAGGAVFAAACHRFAFMRSFLAVLSVAAVVFPVVFLASKPVRELMSGAEYPYAEGDNNGTPVVMLVFDELPLTALMTTGQTINRERYPNFAALADSAHWFRNATTVSHFTDLSVPAMLSGRYPASVPGRKGAPAPTPANYPRNLFSLLGETHQMRVFESVTALAPREARDARFFDLGWDQRQALFWLDTVIVLANIVTPEGLWPALPGLNGQWLDFTGRMADWSGGDAAQGRSPDGRARQVERFIDAIEATEQPSVHFLHVLLPHVPLVFLPSGRYYGPQPALPHGMGRARWHDDPWEAQQGYQRFLLQLGFVDHLLGRIFERLRNQGLFDRALLVVTSDHGESYREGTPPRRISDENLADTALVPLFLKLPGQTVGTVTDRSAQTIDILPTTAALLDSDAGWAFEGENLFGPDAPERIRRVFDAQGEVLSLGMQVPGVDAAIARKQSLFGNGGWEQVYDIGPVRELVGQELSSLAVGEPAPFTVVLERAANYRAYHADDNEIPAHVRGLLTGPGSDARPTLAVAINGAVVATTRSFKDRTGKAGFTAMAPEQYFREGHNRVDVFQLADSAGSTVLHPVRQQQRDASIRLGQVLGFGRDAIERRYILGGLSKPEEKHSWSNGRAVRFEFAIADARDDVTVQVRLFPFLREHAVPVQTVEVLVNGELMDTWVLDQPGQVERSATIPARHLSDGNFLLEFRLPQAVVPGQLGLGGDQRMLGVSFLSLVFSDAGGVTDQGDAKPRQP